MAIGTSSGMPAARNPVLYVIAGPNGAGKTTFAREFLPSADVVEFLNADLLAAGLSPLQPATMAIRSARLLLTRWRELLHQRRDFAFESTLSGRTYAAMLRKARAADYEVRLCYLWLPDVALSLRRVRQRVRMGGHDRRAGRRFATAIFAESSELFRAILAAGARSIALLRRRTFAAIGCALAREIDRCIRTKDL